MKEIKWGMIGTGEVTEQKSAPALSKIPGSKLIAVSSRREHQLRDYAARHTIPFYSTNAEDVIFHPEVNAIYIATPPASHHPYVLLAAKAKKPVYVEKPMALRYSQCIEMLNACNQAEVPLFVAYYRRALPNFLKIKELLEEGAIGSVRFVNVHLYLPAFDRDHSHADEHWRIQPKISGGGHFFDLGSHQLDMLDFLFGPIGELHGLAHNLAGIYEAEDAVNAIFSFPQSKIIGTATWCFTVAPEAKLDMTEIVGSKGRISFSTFDNSAVLLENHEGRKDFVFNMPNHIQQPLIEQIVKELQGEGQASSKGESAIRTAKVMDKIVAEYYGIEFPY